MLFGLSNDGYMSYLNSTIQCFIRVPSFLKHFISELWEKSSDEYEYSVHTPLTNELYQLALAINLKTDMPNLFAKKDGKVYLGHIKNEIDKQTNEYIDENKEHDVIEFIEQLLGHLIEECENKETNYITRTFMNSFQIIKTCTHCNKKKFDEKKSLIIHLDIDDLCQNEQQSYKLEECIKNFERIEQIIDQCDNETCDFFEKDIQKKKQTIFIKLPEAIFIHLKRSKKSIEFPFTEFKVGTFLKNLEKKQDNDEYTLVSVINYSTSNGSDGHYFTFSRDQVSGTWWNIDDDKLVKIKDIQTETTNEAILLLYVKDNLLPEVKIKKTWTMAKVK